MHVTAQSAAEMVMAMLNGDNEDDETPYLDEINAAIRRMQCAACGAFDKHYTAMCPDVSVQYSIYSSTTVLYSTVQYCTVKVVLFLQ